MPDIKGSLVCNSFDYKKYFLSSQYKRKRFLYYSKDLSVISMNHVLFSKMETADWERVRTQLQDDLKNYYSEMGGV